MVDRPWTSITYVVLCLVLSQLSLRLILPPLSRSVQRPVKVSHDSIYPRLLVIIMAKCVVFRNSIAV